MFEPALKKSSKIVTKHFTITLNLPAPRSTWRVILQLGKLLYANSGSASSSKSGVPRLGPETQLNYDHKMPPL